MVGYYHQGVPTSLELENNSNQKKYTINRGSGKGFVISRPLCVLMTIGALLLAILVGLLVFFLVPRYCNGETTPEALTQSAMVDQTDERLPRSIQPLHYRIQIIPDLENQTTSGTVTIILKPQEETNEIVFHVNNITIDSNSVTVRSNTPSSILIQIDEQNYEEGQKYRIVLSEKLKQGREYLLSIKFTGELNSHLQGFYRSAYEDEFGKKRYAASTQFSPTDARRAFPCFDEPSFKANFSISLARPSNLTTLSNMPLERSDMFVERNGWYWDHYQETPKMSTYLVAFIVSDLKSKQPKDAFIKIWSRESLLPQTDYAATIAPKILSYLENYFGIKFPLPKIDIVAVPEFGFNAMENWGLITFRESSLLFDPIGSTADDKRTIGVILAHEIAHQWFGNLVTPKWWNDLWLKEGFATYLEYLGVDYAEPTWKIVEEFLPSEIERAMDIDSLETTRPISFEVKNNRQIRQTFDEISYAKGACIIRMMNNFLGEEAFKKGLIAFLKKYENGNADRQDLFDSLTEEAHTSGALLQNETVKQIMDTWTERAGFPVVTAIADYAKNKLHLYQKRFYFASKDEKASWWVPISFTTDKESNFSNTKPNFWLRGEYDTTEDVKFNKWYLLNVNQTGYFIVNYDEQNWRALIDSVMEVPPLIRAQLISDSMNLARANLLDYDIPLKMIARMAVQDKNIMFIPTKIAFNRLKFLSDILATTPAFGHFEEYHKSVFQYTYNIVTLTDEYDDYLTRRIRKTVLEWACRILDSKCAHDARSKFRDWMIHGDSVQVESNLRDIVYCTSIRDGDQREWDFAYRKYLNTSSPSEKNILLDALGCTNLRWLLSRYIEKLISDPSIRIQDADRVFESVAKNKFGTSIAFDFLRKNWNELLKHYGDGFNILAKMIKVLGKHMNTEFQLNELIRFRDSLKGNISTTSVAFDIAIETVRANVEWMDKNYVQVENWLKKYKDHFTTF